MLDVVGWLCSFDTNLDRTVFRSPPGDRLVVNGIGDNQTRSQLFALAYNLANFLRRLALRRAVRHWSLTTLREKLVKIGAKVVRHAGYVTFHLAEVAIPRRLFRAILRRIGNFQLPETRGSPA